MSELELLRRLWDTVWNKTATMDGGKYVCLTWEDSALIDEAASEVDDWYAANGYPTIGGAS